MTKSVRCILWIVLLGALVVCPKILGTYYTSVLMMTAIYGMFAVSFNLLFGYSGMLSFGHSLFFGMGGYGTVLALKHVSAIPLFGAIGIGVLCAIVLAIILAPLVTRVGGTAFAMIHLAFGQLMYLVALKLRFLSGGEDGIGGFNIPAFLGIDMKDSGHFYYLGMAIVVICVSLAWFLTKTPFAQVIMGIRDNPRRIAYLGYKLTVSKAVIYVVAGAFAGVSGSLLALFQDLVSPDSGFSLGTAFSPMLMTVVGGTGFFGPIWGAFLMQLLDEVTTRFTQQVELIKGLVLVVVILWAPGGLVGLARSITTKLRTRRGPSLDTRSSGDAEAQVLEDVTP
jgi:branched-chain amino acid transport system permease protein